MKCWQYLIKVGRRRKKKIEKYFKRSCLRELKMQYFIGLWSMESAKIKCWKFKLCITESKKNPEYNSEICTNNNNNK